MARMCLTALLLLAGAAPAVEAMVAEHRANPIRKVVTLLQKMQAKVTEEGEKEKELYDKFMCYCKNGVGALEASISAAADTKLPELAADIKASEEEMTASKESLSTAQNDRASAKTAMAEATGLREKEAAAYAATKAEYGANINAITKAVAALEKGMAGSFLQSDTAKTVQNLALNSKRILGEDRNELMAFFQGSNADDSEYAPSAGEVTGILKQMGDEMSAGLKDATAAEDGAIATYNSLMSAKTKEVNALSAAIEKLMKKIGELGVSIAQMKNDLTDTEEALMADKQFLAEMEKSCATKTAEWEERVKTRGEELAALADTIKMLNDDDALELFKKTLPSASSSFMQVQVSSGAARARALAAIRAARQNGMRPHRARMDLIMLALQGKKIGFEKVIGMIDEMVASLKKEQLDDDHKKEYCATEFDLADDSKKALERQVSDLEKAIAVAESGIATTAEEIADIEAGIKALDKSVAEATEQRQEENEDHKGLMAADSAAKELIGMAKNRMQKFYNPKLYKAPPKRELASVEDRIFVNEGGELATTMPPGGIAGTGVTVLAQVSTARRSSAAPPPPPETFGAYTKKSGETAGVLTLMDMLVADLDKEMTESTTAEKDAQADYEAMMKDSAEKRASDSKLLTEKQSTKASLEEDLESSKSSLAGTSKELAATMEYIHSLHLDCDWLMKYFDVRKEARASEVDALGKAKAVLSGADYSLVQTRAHTFLSRK